MTKQRRHGTVGSSAGLYASVIGFVLVGCTALGFAAGWWLDGYFGTSFWMPLLAMLGVAAGFRQMFVMLGEMSQATAKQQAEAAKPAKSTSSGTRSESRRVANREVGPEAKPTKPLFRVPPPPEASWVKKAEVAPEIIEPKTITPETDELDAPEAAEKSWEELSSDELIERWSHEDDAHKDDANEDDQQSAIRL